MDLVVFRGAASVLLASAALVAAAPARAGAGEGRDPAAESARLRAAGLERGFNLDHDQALAAFRAAIAANPQDAAAHRLAAATIWIRALFEQGAVTAEDYLGQARSKIERRPLAPDTAALFRAHLDRALALADARLRANPRDADARFQLGAAYGFLASYTATIEGRVLGAFGAARRAYREHTRALELDVQRRDAALIVGLYRYGVSQLPWHWRLLADLAGLDSGRERGIRLVEDAASQPTDVQTNARFTLTVIYNREGRYDDALRIIETLQQRYPRNRLLWLEAGITSLRAGRPGDARRSLERGLAMLATDPRTRAYGEEARWRYAYGAALAAVGQIDPAARELRFAAQVEGPMWLRARAQQDLVSLGRQEDPPCVRSRC